MFGPIAYLGATEIWMIAGVVVVLFGGAKMAQLGKGLGEGIREFKNSMNPEPENGKQVKADDDDTTKATNTTVEAK